MRLLILLLIFVNSGQADDLIKKGKELFVSKSCALCHQTDENIPCPAGAALKSPKFVGKFWGKKREVHIGIGGPIKEVVLDEEYFLESIEKPFAKIVKGTIPGMAPLPTTGEERRAIVAYVKSLNRD
jgi:cytochrome c2